MNELFTLTGRFKDSAGKPITRLVVMVIDEDLLDADDVLGVGAVDAEGGFRMTFAGTEFRQDALETEETPDLKIIGFAVIEGEAQPKPVFVRSFPDVQWANGRADLGDLVIEGFDPDKPVILEGVKIPDADRKTSKLVLDDATVKACFDEVIPLVEKYTGWTRLADGLGLKVVDTVAPIVLREVLKEKGTAPDSFEAKCYEVLTDTGAGYGCTGGLYDPPTDTIYVNRPAMEQNGIEFLKVILAHELVHAGQFRNTPGLAAYALDFNRRCLGIIKPAEGEPSLTDRRPYMVELEGYATFLERDFIRARHYRMAISDYHSSAVETLQLVAAAIVSKGLGYELHEGPAETTIEDKFKQYEEGVALYRSRSKPGEPAPWKLTVADLPGGAAFAPT